MKITYLHITIIAYFLTDTLNMVEAPTNLRGDLKISDQNNWGDLSKKLNLEGAKFKGGPKILGGTYEPQLCHGHCVKRYSFMFVRF